MAEEKKISDEEEEKFEKNTDTHQRKYCADCRNFIVQFVFIYFFQKLSYKNEIAMAFIIFGQFHPEKTTDILLNFCQFIAAFQ